MNQKSTNETLRSVESHATERILGFEFHFDDQFNDLLHVTSFFSKNQGIYFSLTMISSLQTLIARRILKLNLDMSLLPSLLQRQVKYLTRFRWVILAFDNCHEISDVVNSMKKAAAEKSFFIPEIDILEVDKTTQESLLDASALMTWRNMAVPDSFSSFLAE